MKDNKVVTKKLIFPIIGAAFFYWIVESLMHAFIFEKGDLLEQIFKPSSHEIWMRFVFIFLLLVFSLISYSITKRRSLADEKIKSLQQQLEFILGATKTGLDIIDSDFNLRYIDPQWQKVYGDPTDKKCYEYFMGRNQVCPDCGIVKALETKKPIVTEEILVKEGNRPIQVTTMPFQAENGEWLVAEVNVDVTERKQAEEKLRQSENKYRGLIENLPQKIFLKDRNSIYVSCNENYARDLNIKSDEITGKTDYDFYPKELAEKYRTDDQRIMKLGNTEDIEERYIQNEREFWVHTVKTPIKDEKGESIGLLGIFWDITERKKTEEKIKLFSDAIASAFDCFILTDVKGNITYANESSIRVFGYTHEEFLKLNITKLDADPMVAKQVMQDIAVKGKWSGEVMNIRKNKEIFPCNLSAFIIKDDKGNPKGTMGILRDITTRKKAEEALQESEERYRTLVENASDLIFMIDKKDEVLSVNKSAAILLGKEPNEIIGKLILDLFPAETSLGFSTSLKEVFQTGTNRLSETTMIALGEEKWISANLSPVRNPEGKVVAVMGVTRDITERKKMEAQLIQAERLSAVGTLAYGIAHEFNNILAGILGNAEFGLITNDPKEVKECFQIIQENCERAKSITNNLLAFSRQREIKKQKADVTDAVESVLGLVEREMEKQNIKVERKFNPIPEIVCDLGELSEVALNMITNARDAMQPKGGTLTIEIGKKKDNIEMVFTDTGDGIPDSIKGRIFEPFVTTKGALGQSETPGTGLGLFLSYGIINRYQGKIDVKSEMGKGSQFTVKIPISKNQKLSVSFKVEEDEPVEVPHNLNILLVDDEKPILSSIKKFLESKGHSVVACPSGKKGLRLFKNRIFDLVLSDITMPDMDGIKLISKLKNIDQNVRLIVLTGHLAEEKLDSARKAGADQILTKPFKNEDLYKAIERVVSG